MTLIPLYQNKSQTKHPQNPAADGNTGLWFNKFCNTWSRKPDTRDNEMVFQLSASDNSSAKQQWLNNTIQHYVQRKAAINIELSRAVERQQALANAHDSVLLSVESISPFVTGMGNSNPIENGFTWHHTLGVPYLPASSLKGLIRNWLDFWASKQDDNSNEGDNQGDNISLSHRLFGSSQGQSSSVGGLIFLDALPHDTPEIGADIMTPHYGQWFSHGGSIDKNKPNPEAIPAGWHSPVPIPFLVVKKIKFDIVVMRQKNLSAEHWLTIKQTLPELIENAFNFIGAGAKTAVGYGYFKADTGRTQERNEQYRLAQLPDSEQRFEADIKANNPHHNAEILAAIKLLEGDIWSNCQAEMAAIVQARMQASSDKNYKWKPTSQSPKPDKDKAYKNTLRVLKYLGPTT